MSSLGLLKHAYFRIGIHGAPAGTLLYQLHNLVEAGYIHALRRGLVDRGLGQRFTPPNGASTTKYKVLQEIRCVEYAHRLYDALKPMDVIDGKMIRKGRDLDGGYVMLDEICKNSIAYSFGIGGEISWDMDIATCGLQLFQYDHTIPSLPINHPNFHFFKRTFPEPQVRTVCLRPSMRF
jgi:hypothetical protein